MTLDLNHHKLAAESTDADACNNISKDGGHMYSDDDTDWALSARGNYWKRLNGKVLVIGEKNNGEYWAMYDGDLVKGSFSSEQKAKTALEEGCDATFEQPWGSYK